jgi:hypothetical protein
MSPLVLILTVVAVLFGGPDPVIGQITSGLQSILKNTHHSKEYGYPTDITRDLLPIPVHSHNDYWRERPFYTGLSKGCTSTEADVWLYNGTLFVRYPAIGLSGSSGLSLMIEGRARSICLDP